MDDIKEIILQHLEPIFGRAKTSFQQIRFDCLKCDSGQKKNLEININTGAFHCWSCNWSGHVAQLLKEYASDNLWKPYFKSENIFKKAAEKKEKSEIIFPPNTIPFYRNEEVNNYLIQERGMDEKMLIDRKVQYCFDLEDGFYNHILFPFYDKDGNIHTFTAQNYTTKKYKNTGPLNFVTYEEFLNPLFPIIITEGIYDALSVPNAIPLLGTNIFQAVLRFCQDKKIILALDNEQEVSMDYKKQAIKKLYEYGATIVTLFELGEHKDLNAFWMTDRVEMKMKMKVLFELLINV
jgi:hypothetical protein